MIATRRPGKSDSVRAGALLLAAACLAAAGWRVAMADGMMVPPRGYQGTMEEHAQEAIIIFQEGSESGGAVEDLILKITIKGKGDHFAWVVPFPTEPKVEKESPKLFEELFTYVEARTRRPTEAPKPAEPTPSAPGVAAPPVEVLSRKVVGNYDVAVVRENQPGALNKWLEAEGYQKLEDAEDIIGFYRQKGYVFSCIKVSQAALAKDKPVDSHPLRFTFKTGGRDGIYYPMRMTGLQTVAFDVNLYIFYHAWLNDRLSRYGYVHRGFQLRYRDWDSSACTPNAGKAWSAPETDPFLGGLAYAVPTVKGLMQKLHPGERYYLTNIQARGLAPAEVRQWADDLWVFPYYTDVGFVPYDARPGGPARAAWANVEVTADGRAADAPPIGAAPAAPRCSRWVVLALIGVVVVLLALWLAIRLIRARARA